MEPASPEGIPVLEDKKTEQAVLTCPCWKLEIGSLVPAHMLTV